MPVHLVEMRDGRLREVYVEPNPLAGNGQPAAEPFREVLGEPSRAAIEEHFRWLGLTLPEGHRAEVNLNARRWMASVAEAMAMGFVITIDYGAPAEELLARAPGTLMCYHRQQYNNHPFSRVGEQDITAHVDFSALVEAGKEEGLMLAGLVTQADFLRNLGLAAYERQLELDRASGRITAAQMYDRRSVLRELVDPRSLGAFRVLVQHTGVDCPILDGLNPTNPRKRALWVDPPRWEW
jgi:SAM-dependent MidA family methyltransferase